MTSSSDALVTSLAERSRFRAQLWRHTRHRPLLYRLIVNVRNDGGGRQFVTRHSAAVVDGFERSGNTYAYLSFMMANPDARCVGHHTHSSAQFLWASRWQIPSILLTREPADVALSVNLRWPARALDEILDDYVRFHERLLDLCDDLVVAPFETVVADFTAIVRALNARFGTAFSDRDPGDSDDQVFAAIEARNRSRYGQVNEGAVARPSSLRQAALAPRRAELERPSTARALARAREVRGAILATAPWGNFRP